MSAVSYNEKDYDSEGLNIGWLRDSCELCSLE